VGRFSQGGFIVPKVIFAVAIGDSGRDKNIPKGSPNSVTGVRPYIKGAMDRLNAYGDNYAIEYRECADVAALTALFAALPACDVVLCLSTTVVDVAIANLPNTTAIVGMTSYTGRPANVTGVSAQRPQIARQLYVKFLQSVRDGLDNVYILHKAGYPPSDDGLHNIHDGIKVPVAAPYGQAQIQAAINGIAVQGQGGLLVLPVDYFFAYAPDIVGWAQSRGLPDFWPVCDWVNTTGSSAFGGYGVSQFRCGQLLADLMHLIFLKPASIPPFTVVHSAADFVWCVSDVVATRLHIPLGSNSQMQHAPCGP
jgi:hypothetical protein